MRGAAPVTNAPADPSGRPGSSRANRSVRGLLREPFTRRAWAELLYAVTALPVAIAGFAFIVASLYAGVLLAITFLGLPLIAASSLGARYLGSVNRRMADRLLGLRVTAPARFSPRPGFLGWVQSGLRDPVAWRARAYLLLKFPVAVLTFTVAVGLRMYALFYVASPLLWNLESSTCTGPYGETSHCVIQYGSFYFDTWPKVLLLVAQGIVMWWLAPWALRAGLAPERFLVRALLGPTSMSQRIQSLERTRAEAVDDAASRLRRIERDLHDGTQAQLVALAMKLGLAKEKLAREGTPDIDRARELIDTAHRTAREAINELRDLARGIHPPVLDTGLEPALSTLAARSLIPVELIVDVPHRPTAAIETIAYFCAAELLTNVAKHSEARHAILEVVHVEGLLRVRVTDNGVGGARIDGGGGLAGLASRVRTVDGQLYISSPRGGPTVVTAELPSHA